MKLETLLHLAQDRPNSTPELQSTNDFYGHAHILKKYCGMPEDYSLKVVAEHAVYIADPLKFIWEVEAKSPMPVFLCANKRHAEYVAAETGKVTFAIGPWIYYAMDKRLREQCACLPSEPNIFVVPTHSSHLVDVYYDVDEFMGKVRAEYPGSKITVLMYWKDILSGVHEQYLRHDVQLVTAGHIFDVSFLPRLAWLLGKSSCLVTNCMGSHAFFATMLRRPVWHIPQDISYYGSQRPKDAPSNFRAERCSVQEKLNELFARPQLEVSEEQAMFVDDLLGMDQIRTPEQIREILLVAEKLYAILLQNKD